MQARSALQHARTPHRFHTPYRSVHIRVRFTPAAGPFRGSADRVAALNFNPGFSSQETELIRATGDDAMQQSLENSPEELEPSETERPDEKIVRIFPRRHPAPSKQMPESSDTDDEDDDPGPAAA
jgi:predicted HicB family RNase H-like nuclease